MGAVLTGSMALQGYRWSGRRVIGRKSNDWDFLLTRSQLLEFFKREKIYDLDLDSKVYRINNSLFTFYDKCILEENSKINYKHFNDINYLNLNFLI